MKLRHVAFFLVFILGVVGGNFIIKHQFGNEIITPDTSNTVNKDMIDFSLPDIQGVAHNIHEWQGRVIVLNFWATWCPPCLKETPLFVELQEKYGEKGLQFVGIAIDDLEKVIDFTNTYGVNYPTLIGAEDAVSIAKQYGNRFGALPYTVVINRKGKISFIQSGEFKQEMVEKTINTLL